ncbi:MAG: hypothetical protein AB7U75_08740 [Hyphomicrobiaceae bacterium]
MTTIFKTLSAAALACGLAISASSGASAAGSGVLAGLKAAAPHSPIVEVGGRRYGGHGHYHGYRGRNIGLGILGAAAATAIIAGAARADGGYYRRGNRCEYYDYKCSRGYGWACRKFDYYCD